MANHTPHVIRRTLGRLARRIGFRTAFWTDPARGVAGDAWPLTRAERAHLRECEQAARSVFGGR